MRCGWRLLALPLLLVGCGTAPTNGEPDLSDGTPVTAAPLVVGPIASMTHHATASRLEVRAGEGSIEMCGIMATVDAGTRFLARESEGRAEEIRIADLRLGDRVEVYVSGPVAESCPVQGRADRIVRIERAGA